MNGGPERYDVLVIGAGIGGLIAACQLGQAGKRVLLAENLGFLGGRFSAFPVDGVEISSGAFHTFPHGDSGPMAQALRRSGVHITIPPARVFASFHADGRHYTARTGFDVFAVAPTRRDRVMLWRILALTWLQRRRAGSYGDWLVAIGASERVRVIFDRFCQFALSITAYDLPYAEGREVLRAVLKYGLPGVPKGGAREVTRQLARAAADTGVTIRRRTRVEQIMAERGQVCGAMLYDRRRDRRYRVDTVHIVSSAGSELTAEMVRDAGLGAAPHSPRPAVGLKLQVLSPKSLIDHDSIMFCLDTQRVAGILQATNVDPELAPPGKHLLISHQTTPAGADWQEERDMALADWRYLFGSDFDECEVIGVSHFPARFPVNHAAQGYDLRVQPFADAGLWMVGDGMKPPGLMMVEGVAASAEQVVARILGRRDRTPWDISRGAWLRGAAGTLARWSVRRR